MLTTYRSAYVVTAAAFFCMCSAVSAAYAPAELLPESKKCVECHKKETPVIYEQWGQSKHYRANVGCMECQNICPENQRFRDDIEQAADFTGDETRMILDSTPLDGLPEETVEKLTLLDMHTEYAIVPRNLKALMANSNR